MKKETGLSVANDWLQIARKEEKRGREPFLGF